MDWSNSDDENFMIDVVVGVVAVVIVVAGGLFGMMDWLHNPNPPI